MTKPDGGALATPEAAGDDSSRSAARPAAREAGIAGRIRGSGPSGWLLLGLAAGSAVMLFLAELATLSYRTIGIGACSDRVSSGECTTTGGDAHSYALWLLALMVLVLAVGAAVGRSRPAALGVLVAGIAVLVIALLLDLPDLDDTRGIETRYNQVAAHTGAAFPFELVGGVLAVAAGLLALTRRPGPEREPEPQAATAAERAAARAERRRES